MSTNFFFKTCQDNWGTYGDDKNQNVFELTAEKTLKHLPLGTTSPWEVRENQFVSGPLAVLDSYYGKYTTCPDDAQERLDILHKTYVKDMKAENIYPLVFMTQEDINTILPQIEEINSTVEEINEKKDHIVEIIHSTASILEENSASSEEIAASTQEVTVSAENLANTAQLLEDNSNNLIEQVNNFKLKEDIK